MDVTSLLLAQWMADKRWPTGVPTQKWRPGDDVKRNRVHSDIDPLAVGEGGLYVDFAQGGPEIQAMAKSMAKTKERPVEWVWRGRLARGGITIVDGDPEMGKTTVMLDICAKLSRGGELPDGHSSVPCRCLIASTEERSESRMQPILRLAGAVASNIFWFEAPRDKNGREQAFSLPDDIDYIEGEIADCEADIVILDPVMGFVSEGIRPNDDASMRKMLTPLASVAESYDCCVILIRHLKKDPREKNPLYRGGGSIGIIGQARAELLVGKPPGVGDLENERVLAVSKLNLLDKRMFPALKFELEASDENPDYPVVNWLGECPLTARDLLATPDARKLAPARDEARAVIGEILSLGPVDMPRVYRELDAAGVNRDTAKKAIQSGLGVLYHKWSERGVHGAITKWWLHLIAEGCPEECPERKVIRYGDGDEG